MNIGYNFDTNNFISNDKVVNDEEVELIKAILTHMGLNPDNYRIEKNSTSYTTLKFGAVDLIRLHNSNSSCWIKIPIFNKDKYINDERFSIQENKNELFWKSTINNIFDYEDVITDAIEGIISMNSKQKTYEPNDDEIRIATLLMDNLDIDFSISKTSSECTNVYLGGTPRVIFDIKCTTRSKWIRFRGKDFNKKIDISNLDDKLIDKLKNKIKKELE